MSPLTNPQAAARLSDFQKPPAIGLPRYLAAIRSVPQMEEFDLHIDPAVSDTKSLSRAKHGILQDYAERDSIVLTQGEEPGPAIPARLHRWLRKCRH